MNASAARTEAPREAGRAALAEGRAVGVPPHRIRRDGRRAEALPDRALGGVRRPPVRGASVHVGDAAGHGVADGAGSGFCEALRVEPGETAVFRACGVAPRAAATASRAPFAVTLAPGPTFVTGIPDAACHV